MRILKPSTVIKKWEALCEKVKNDKTKRKAPGRKEAKRHAEMAGMKSMLEVEVADMLDKMKIKWQYEPHQFDYHLCPKWKMKCGVKYSKYTPDFYLPKYDIYIEVKGKMTLATRKKMEAVKHHNPKIKIHMVFGYAKNKLYATKNSSRYWQWAEGLGFPWGDKEVCKEWFKK